LPRSIVRAGQVEATSTFLYDGPVAHFPSTQWSLVRQSGMTPSGRTAFAELACTYRAAILAFFRARLPSGDAEDATQSFLASSFEHAWWSRADAQLGSFRNFLLVLLRRHVAHLRDARKPSADAAVDIDASADDAPAADRQFDLRFVVALTSRAIDEQRVRYSQRDRRELFERLLPLLTSPPEHGELKTIAATMGMPANSLTVELNRLRQRLREQMRQLVEDLCADERSFAAEWEAVQHILEGG
jgi:DNA-directed RNA polymerase specialized sigma24 family protein